MADFTTLSQLNGYTKDIWSKLVNLCPDALKLYPKLPFQSAEKQGGKYKQGVVVAEEAGFTHAASGDGAFSVNSAVSLETQDAYVDGFQTVLQSSIDYESAARAASSKQAYRDIVGLKLENMIVSAKKRVECELLYGQVGIGKIASSTNTNSTKTVLTITAASHAPLIWAGKKNFQISVYNGTTKVGTGDFTIASANVADATRTVTVTGASGDISALDTAVSGNAGVLDIYWAGTISGTGTVTYKSMVGLMKAAATTSGTLWNIDVSQYDLFAGNVYDAANGAFSFAKGLNACEVLVARGLDEDVVCYVHPKTWANIMQDQAALRRYGGRDADAKNGFRSVEFDFQAGSISFTSHGMIKAGEALILPKSGVKRIGAQDVSFKRPGNSQGNGENIFWDDPTKAGYSYRLYSHQAVFAEEPAKLLKVTGIVNS